jgi:predicted AAA+ superfamily ATPase
MQHNTSYQPRFFTPPKGHFFLLGPRGTGKSTFLRHHFPEAIWVDLLKPELFTRYSARPDRLEELVKANIRISDIIVDEIQLVPELLNVIHRLIEMRLGPRFILTGSSARKLKSTGTNLLAGRALLCTMHPFMIAELEHPPSLDEILATGLLPIVRSADDPQSTLRAYVGLYMQQEVFQESLVRNSGNFSRFLEVMSFSHGSILNVSNVARTSEVPRNTVNSYIQILEDILLAFQLNVFKKRASRKLTAHAKFYFFDSGVYTMIRPGGQLDRPEEIAGSALEGLVIQHLRSWIAYRGEGDEIFYWRSRGGVEVDIVLYGKQVFVAVEVKNSARVRPQDLRGLREFKNDYPECTCVLLYRGEERLVQNDILAIPVERFLKRLHPHKSFSDVLEVN